MGWYNIVDKKFFSRWCGIELYNIGTKANAFLPLIVASVETEKRTCLSCFTFCSSTESYDTCYIPPDMIRVGKCDLF